ncbi:beta-ketoacyl synthase domain-containing protein [Xylariales sp. PMI_506]|nr:beta-ketoacyl synthase domain-containing protein [Xylariales sp. PMI_506]
MPNSVPIAIVGMACRLPGNVASPSEFWELCARARSGFSAVPQERFNHEAFYHPNPGKTGAYHAAGGYFLGGDVTAFDAPFFGLTEKEALSMDPQQRLLLECTFEALESAGIPKHSIVGEDVGVFVGGSLSEYESHLGRDSDTIPMHQATGCAHAMQSNRLSHFFDLKGPSFTADTACSSSLVALHLACQSLRLGESTQAIVGACHLNLLPESFISFSTCRLLSDSGRSISFDERGSGFGRGEGCGILILKPLSKAIEDQDSIRAVIMGSGINQDGKTPGITMPSGAAQERLINQVYRNAGIDPSDCGFVEAHGTGTKVGDPIEATALHNSLGQGRTAKDPLYIGSVKSNIGHLEAASGIVAVIKAAMMLERSFILPNHDFKKPNTKIPWKEWSMKVPPSQRPWPKGKKYISVNNFGFGGTNAHVVLGKAPFVAKLNAKARSPNNSAEPAGKKIFIISANDKASLATVIQKLVVYLEQRPEIFEVELLNNLAYTLGQRKSLLPWRVAIPALTSFDLIETLTAGKVIPGKQLDSLRIGLIFTGQGAQWYAMGRELFNHYPVYAAAIERADHCLRRLGAGWSLLEELSRDADSSNISAAHISQPSCTAVQLALTDLLRTWGIQPEAVVGHSSGEIGAAYAAGIISFESAVAISYHRGRLIPILKTRFPSLDGAMMAVGGTKEEIQPLIDGLQTKQARIACYNSPSSLTISGDSRALIELEGVIKATNPDTFCRRLQVDVAYHSHHMNIVAKEYSRAICDLPPAKRESSVRFYSSLHGRQIDGSECNSNYWVSNLTCPVRFSEAMECMLQPHGEHKTGVNMLVELGPHSALQGPIRQILKAVGGPAEKLPYTSPIVRKKDAVESAMDCAAMLIMKGALLNMSAINFPKPTKSTLLTDLPNYSWNHQNKYWKESRLSYMHRNRADGHNDLIGTEAIYSDPFAPTWRNIVSLDDLPWLRHHQVQGVTVFPISGFISMAIEAAGQLASRSQKSFDKFDLKNVSVTKPLALTDAQVEMTITLSPQDSTSYMFRICTWDLSTGWTEHCVGQVATRYVDVDHVDSDTRRTALRKEKELITSATQAAYIEESALYDSLSELGVVYGASFQGITGCKASTKHATATISLADVSQHMPNNHVTDTILHPTLLESIVEMYWPVLSATSSAGGKVGTVYLPSSVERMSVSRNITTLARQAESTLRAYSTVDFASYSKPKPTMVAVFATASEQSDDAVLQIDNLKVSPILDGVTESQVSRSRELCYRLDWEQIRIPVNLPQGTGLAIIHGESESQYLLANSLAVALDQSTSRLPEMGTLQNIDAAGRICIFLSDLDQPFFSTLTEDQFNSFQKTLLASQGILWITRGANEKSTSPEANMISGMSRTIRSETGLPFATLDLDAGVMLNTMSTAEVIMTIFCMAFDVCSSSTSEMEFMERSGKIFTPRIVHDEKMNELVYRSVNSNAVELQPFGLDSRLLKMELSNTAGLDEMHFIDDDLVDTPLGDDEIEFEVNAIGLSNHDTKHERDRPLGLEASGIITRVGLKVTSLAIGCRVAAITPTRGAFATRARSLSSNAFAIPDSISFQEAATLPLAWLTAYYGLVERARLRAGHRVLISSATSAIGQAAICIAQKLGADVYASVSYAEEKATLVSQYGITESHIVSNRAETFEAAVKLATGDNGMDVVLITTPGDASLLDNSWACLTRFGSLVNAAHGGNDGVKTLLAASANSNASYVSVDICGLAAERPLEMRAVVKEIERLLHDGHIRDLGQLTVFPLSELSSALRLVQGDRVTSKIVVVPSAEDMVMATRSAAVPNILRSDRTYVLIGGTGGLGRSMAKWMVTHGARTVVLVSRSGSVTEKVQNLMDSVSTCGAQIIVKSCDVADRGSVQDLFSQGLADLPPVAGLVHGAMVLRDVLFEKLSWDDYKAVVESKVQGAWNIHRALEGLQVPLDFFVVLSSVAGVVGNRGQAAYAAANTFLDAFAKYRIALGLPAVSLDLTAVSDVGYLADIGADRAAEVAKNLGSDSMCEAEVLALLGAAITGDTASCDHQVITGVRITADMRPFWTDDAKFKAMRLVAEAEAEAAAAEAKTGQLSPGAALKAAQDVAEAEGVICSGLVTKISAVLMLEPEDLDVTRSLSHYPLDSLVAIEIRTFITREFEANMQVLELLSSGSIQTLTKAICQKSKLCARFH